MRSRWLQYILAILAGNALYFLARPFLAPSIQHQAFQMDAGLVIDFTLCVAAYFVIRRWLS